MKSMKCPRCSSSDTSEDLIHGDLHCNQCGHVDDGCPPCPRCGMSSTRYFGVYLSCSACGFDDMPQDGIISNMRKAGCI